MKMNQNLQTAILEQAIHELAVSNFYACAATVFDDAGLPNIADWARDQAKEERGHSDIFMGYLAKRGAVIRQFDVPSTVEIEENEDYVDLIEKIAQAENDNLTRINDLFLKARDAKDAATEHFLAPILNEQVEEVDTADTFLAMAQGGADLAALDHWVQENLAED